MKSMLIMAVVFALFTTNGFCQERKTWHLEELVSHALKNREDISAQEDKIRQAESKVKEAFSHYFPRINLLAAYTKAESDISLDLSDNKVETEVNTQVNVPLPFPSDGCFGSCERSCGSRLTERYNPHRRSLWKCIRHARSTAFYVGAHHQLRKRR